jgi:hypothetical protein
VQAIIPLQLVPAALVVQVLMFAVVMVVTVFLVLLLRLLAAGAAVLTAQRALVILVAQVVEMQATVIPQVREGLEQQGKAMPAEELQVFGQAVAAVALQQQERTVKLKSKVATGVQEQLVLFQDHPLHMLEVAVVAQTLH